MEFLKKHWMTIAILVVVAYGVNKALNKEVELADKRMKNM